MPNLNDKQIRFADEYAIDGSATRAAIAAGYPEKTARVVANRMLKHAGIREYLAQRTSKADQELEVTSDRVLKEIAAIAFCTGAEIAVHNLERPEDINRLPENLRFAIPGWRHGPGGKLSPITPTVSDVIKALGRLSNHIGLFTDAPKTPGIESDLGDRLEAAHLREDEQEQGSRAALVGHAGQTQTPQSADAAPAINVQQVQFAEAYLIEHDSTRAAIAAGYSEKSARQAGRRLLADDGVRTYLAVRAKEIAKRLDITPERLRKKIAAIAFFRGGELADAGLEGPEGLRHLPEKLRLAIPGWKYDTAGIFIPMTPTVDSKARALNLLQRLDGPGKGDPIAARVQRGLDRVAALEANDPFYNSPKRLEHAKKRIE